MFYIYFIILTTIIILFFHLYNKWVKKQNEIIMLNNREFNENTPYKDYLPKVTVNVALVYIFGLFIIFIMGRVSLCNLTEHEYKNQEVSIPFKELTISDNEYLLYVDDKLTGFDMEYIKVIVDNNITTPYIKNYYTRTIKSPPKHPQRYFLYNRKEVKISDWKKTYESCGCGGADLTLVIPSEYKIKTK